ncbi:type IV pilus modification protein PilV [Marinobacter sp. HL-58]|uniref:type IV pilus modification protein PilV n=1 Tax=Marinobacter sp. HL-58 TaxID=1479237 RepID=UPI00068EE506|nr:type IV pilus modification protein PilV [Marinobacter sp. HL-58]KPQ01848.1 MAG: T4SS system assembly protein PilV [Marinobacter sp. HL-58]
MNVKISNYCVATSSRTSSRQSGIALIEVLVAVLILAIGLLGMASMQGLSSQMTNAAEQRTQAVLLSSDIMDRIRSNRNNRAQYDDLEVSFQDTQCVPDYQPNNGQSVSENDIEEWANLVVCLLPEGTAVVDVDNVTGEVDVTIDWEKRDPDDAPVNLRTVI